MRHRVLIVDDDADFRASARSLLEMSGFDVVGEAEDGAAALVQADLLRPDVVLLDVQLPDLDGIEVAARLRQRGSTRGVILTSARAATDYGARLEEAPAAGFVGKADLTGPAIAAMTSPPTR